MAVFRQASDLMDIILEDEMMSSTKRNDAGETMTVAEEAQAKAGMYGFFAALCNQRPDGDLVRRLRTVGIDSFVRIMEEEKTSPEITKGLSEMAQFIGATIDDSEGEVEELLGVDWTRLFRGINPGYRPPPPYEGIYQSGQGGQLEVMQLINRIYHENGVTIGTDSPNRPDYIGLEMDFLRYLAEQEAEAWEQGDEDMARSYADKGTEFFKKHVGSWVSRFCDQALEHAKTDFYRGFLHLMNGVAVNANREEMV